MAGRARPRLVIVDDQPFVALLREALCDRYQVVAVGRERLSRRSVVDARPDAVVIDVDLRADDALARLGELRDWGSLAAVPTIMTTADGYAVREHSAALEGMPGLFVLAKPFSLDQLESLIALALGSPVAGRPGAGN